MPLIKSSEELVLALSQAVPEGPSGLPEPDPGAVLALACHCVMVDSGLKCILPSGGDSSDRWSLPPKWAVQFKDEWLFKYSMCGKRNTLALHCSLQRATGRMLVSTIEINGEKNTHLLGLQLEKYVPEVSQLRSRDWRGVVQHGEALVAMMQQHVIRPLLEGAEDIPAEEAGVDDITAWAAAVNEPRSWWQWIRAPSGPGGGGSYVVPAVVVTGIAVAAVAWYVTSKRHR